MTREPFRLLMLSAMYENGGNTVHRLLDGHPRLRVYPFESQLGTRLVDDALASTFPKKYRWPELPLTGTPEGDYRLLIDEECKVRARTPHVSKFRHVPFDFDDEERKRIFVAKIESRGRSRGNAVTAFFEGTFEAWKDAVPAGPEPIHVGYSPILVVDAAKIVADLAEAHVLHVVRNPWSAYADHKKRPVPLSLADYLLGWVLCQHHAALYSALHPGRVHVLRAEDVFRDPVGTLGGFLGRLSCESSEALARPSWNGTPLTEVFPWGTIRIATEEANRTTAEELTPGERDEVRLRAGSFLDTFGYRDFLAG